MNVLFVVLRGGAVRQDRGARRRRGCSAAAARTRCGHDVRVVMPMYARVQAPGPRVRDGHPRGRRSSSAAHASCSRSTQSTAARHSNVPGLLRPLPGPLRPPGHLHGRTTTSTCASRSSRWAALIICQRLGFAPDIVHANDWQTALIPLAPEDDVRVGPALRRRRAPCSRSTTSATRARSASDVLAGDRASRDAAAPLPSGPAARRAHQLPPHRHPLRERDHDGEPDATRARSRRRSTASGSTAFLRAARERPLRHPQRHRRGRVEPRARHAASRTASPPTTSPARSVNKQALLARVRLPYRPRGARSSASCRASPGRRASTSATKVLPRCSSPSRVQLVVLGTGEPQYEEFFSHARAQFPHAGRVPARRSASRSRTSSRPARTCSSCRRATSPAA